MTPLKKMTIRVHQFTYERLKESRLSDGEEIERMFRSHDHKIKEIEKLNEQVVALQKEKQLLFEVTNKMNMTLDILNTMVSNMNVTEFIAHDVDATEVVQAAQLKQEGRVNAMRNY
ncbi:hypothetical protein CF100_14455 [Listeria monocytogenes]|uniref:hypothetical protein n=1 Tax=Listeria seeligeri TaxID=1640 RepID=UPI0010F06F81|nr:hypothetical protein [Listeria seeligeri]EAD2540870.1 hypothetical protein [Listeria monocytogenes]EAE2213114.1 hypothetical protein [Listeria monocytogenes]EAF0919719.1 hypothetical protein [Listeria monocytogenes]MBC1775979.1 hypothetical protein [Listeria seeligeri]